MREPYKLDDMNGQTGGITILVVLSLLVLLTIAAVGMSRNSFREVVISGTSRQGVMARNVADSGIEWSIQWLHDGNMPAATGTAVNLYNMKAALSQNTSLAGRAYDVMSVNPLIPDLYVPAANTVVTLNSITTPSGTTMNQTLTAGITYMGKLSRADYSQGIGSNASTPAITDDLNAPNLWAVRTDAQVTSGAVTFIHAKEVWTSTAVSQAVLK